MKESNNNSIESILIAVIVIVFIVAMQMCGVKTTRERAVENAIEEMRQSAERSRQSLDRGSQKLNEYLKELQKERIAPCKNN